MVIFYLFFNICVFIEVVKILSIYFIFLGFVLMVRWFKGWVDGVDKLVVFYVYFFNKLNG